MLCLQGFDSLNHKYGNFPTLFLFTKVSKGSGDEKNNMFNSLKSVLIALAITSVSALYGQNYKWNVSGSFGPLNPKIRLQVEKPYKERSSYGVNFNYYLVNWTGPMFEPFFRVYGKKTGNEEGTFLQAKAIYGNLLTLNFDNYDGALENKRWSTFGAALNFGYKTVLGKHITLEGLTGVRFVSPPVLKYKSGYNPSEYTNAASAVGWYATTGLPLEFQFKIGYQF